jgi:hypothetical protein
MLKTQVEAAKIQAEAAKLTTISQAEIAKITSNYSNNTSRNSNTT